MRNYISILGILIIGMALGGFVTYFSLKKSMDSDEVATMSALIVNTANFVDIYMDLEISTQVDKNKILNAIRNQELLISTMNLNIENLDAAGFDGMCRIVSSNAVLFNKSSSGSIDYMAEKIIKYKMENYRDRVIAESVKRSKRVGDLHRCSGIK